MIILDNNSGFEWNLNESKTIYFKGYININKEYINKKNMIILLENIKSYEEFIFFIKQCNGSFAIIVEQNDEYWIAVDRARSIPIFYTIDGKHISDSVMVLKNKLEKTTLDKVSISEMILSSYVYGNNTTLIEIKQLQLGECAQIAKDRIKIDRYYYHFNNEKKSDEEELINNFENISLEVFNRLINSINGKRVVIPLSGGYDSRYIVSMLKKLNYNNVICYTYGDKEQYEVKYSKKIAKELGFKWYFVEYSNNEWRNLFSKEFQEYCKYCHNFSSVPHIQDFLALKKLKENNILNDDDIIINGFCGDLPAGSFVKGKNDYLYINYDLKWISEYIFNENYNHINCRNSDKEKICERIYNELKKFNVNGNSFDKFTSVYEAWFTGARPSKWVVNSNRVYEFFGMEWRMPLWDNEFIDFWYTVDNDLRRDTYLYQKYLFEKLFEPLNIDMKKPNFTKGLSIKYKKSIKRKLKIFILKIFTVIKIYSGITIYKKNDVNNYTALENILIKKIKNKKFLNHRNIYTHQLFAFWWCENIYGEDFIKLLLKGDETIEKD